MEEISRRVHCKVVEIYGEILEQAELEAILQFCAGAGQMCEEVVFDIGHRLVPIAETVDSIVEVGSRIKG